MEQQLQSDESSWKESEGESEASLSVSPILAVDQRDLVPFDEKLIS